MTAKLNVLDQGILYANPHPGDWAIHAYHPTLVELADGRWLAPFDVTKRRDDPTPLHPYVIGLCSSDRGRTGDERVRIAGGPGP